MSENCETFSPGGTAGLMGVEFEVCENTTGVVLGDGNTNSEAKLANKSAKLKLTDKELDSILFVLDIAGVIPVVGIAADGAAAIIRALTGDLAGAAMSLFGFIPVIGDFAGAGKVTAKIAKNPVDALNKLKLANQAVAKLGEKFKKVADFFKRQYKIVEDFIYKHAPRGSLPTRKSQDSGVQNQGNSNKPNKKCPKTCKPVNPVLGIKILLDDDDIDFVLQGDFPLAWIRQYASDSLVGRGEKNDPIGWFGQGWGNNWGEQLYIKPEEDLIEYIDVSGREIHFPNIIVNKSYYLRNDDIRIHHDAMGQFRITSGASEQGDGVQLHFNVQDLYGVEHTDEDSYSRKQRAFCTGKSDAYGNRIDIEYHRSADKAHLPQYITDSSGRRLQLVFDYIKIGQQVLSEKGFRLLQVNELTHLSDTNIEKIKSGMDAEAGKLLTSFSDVNDLIIHVQDLIDKGICSHDILHADNLVNYHYDAEGNLVKVSPHLTPVRSFDYKNHIMTAHHLEGGVSSYYEYDEYLPTGKVLTNHVSNGISYHFDYCESHTVVTEAKGTENERQTLYHFNQDKRWTGTTDAMGNQAKFELDDYDRPIKIIASDGGINESQYSGGNLTSIKQLVGYDPVTNMPTWRTQQYIYEQNQLTEIIDPLGHSTLLSYDFAGQINQITDANGNSTKIERDDKGRTSKQTLANGSTHSYVYNNKGELICQTDCSGHSTHYQYDELGRITQITDAKGNTTKLTYDHQHNGQTQHTDSPVYISYPDGSSEQFEYDPIGRLLKHTDPKGNETQYDYTVDDLPTKRTDALGHTLAYEYDNLRRLTKLINENGEQWTFNYDKADNLISETRFDGYTSYYEYDSNGQLIHQTDNPSLNRTEQRHIYLERDLLGQLTHKHSLDFVQHKGKHTQRHHKTKYQYDIAGQLIKATSPDATTELTYDQLGQLISERLLRHHQGQRRGQQTGQQVYQHTLTHEYDELGNRTKTTLPDGKTLNSLYYGSGHLYNQSITDEQGNVSELRHSTTNELHQEISRQQGSLDTQFDYDPMGRLLKQSNQHIQRHYAYDALGQLTHLSGNTNITALTSKGYQRNHQYQYDPIGRLTQHKLTDFAKQTGTTETFAFDPASNRVPVQNNNQTNQYNKSKLWKRTNHLKTHNKHIEYRYDKHGRMEFKTQTPLGTDGEALKQSGKSVMGYMDTLKLTYNANDELEKTVRIHQQGFEVVTTTTTYHYDAFGRRVAKHSDTQTKTKLTANNNLLPFEKAYQTNKTNKSTTLMLWDGNRQAQEYTDTHVFTTVYDQDSFVPVARLVWLKDGLLQASNDEQYSDKPNTPNNPIQIYHYHNDHLGTPNELTNNQGEVVWLADYEAWGNTAKVVYTPIELQQIQIAKDELQPIRFQGQTIDQETGLHYNRFRYYDPDVGMFISRDPIGLMGGNNIFQYAPNPIGWIDPWGLAKESVYRLVDDAGKTIYYGITGRDEYTRQLEHIRDGKLFAKMEVISKGLTHDQARSIEGALIRDRIPAEYRNLSVEEQLKKSGLINKNRGRDPSRWTSDDPLKDLEHKFLDKPEEVAKPGCKC